MYDMYIYYILRENRKDRVMGGLIFCFFFPQINMVHADNGGRFLGIHRIIQAPGRGGVFGL